LTCETIGIFPSRARCRRPYSLPRVRRCCCHPPPSSAYDLVTYRSVMENDLSTLADLIGSNSTAALTFNDPGAAKEILQGPRAQPHIVSACIYVGDGGVFTTYRREDGQQDFSPPAVQPTGIEFRVDRLLLFHRIALDGQMIGTVYLESDLLAMRSRVRRYLVIVTLILITSLSLAYVLASKLQRIISGARDKGLMTFLRSL
jgi:hypothetical protein